MLFERSKVRGEPNFSSAGTPTYTIEKFKLPQEVIDGRWDMMRITGPSTHAEFVHRGLLGYILDFRKLKTQLLSQAERAGACILTGVAVTGIEPSGDEARMLIRKLRTDYIARVVVDASGHEGVIATSAGLRPRMLTAPCPGLEVIIEGEWSDPVLSHSVDFYLGSGWVPHGYGWIFPMGPSRLKVGMGIGYSTSYGKSFDMNALLQSFVNRVPGLARGRVVEKHGGTLYCSGQPSGMVKGNILAIGDAANTINPLGAEGIRHALQSSALAYPHILAALKNEDLNELLGYEHDWRKYVGHRWRLSGLLARYAYVHFSDSTWDRAVRGLAKLTSNEAFQLLFEYRFRMVATMFRRRLLGQYPSRLPIPSE